MQEKAATGSRSAIVAYGSETGSAQDVAEELAKLARRLRFTTRVVELNGLGLNELIQCDVFLLAISTTGQGELPVNARSFWKRLRSNRLHNPHLAPVHFASFGLGDSSYPQYNWAHRKLNNRLRQLGAQSICERGESDEQQPEGVDGSFVPWTVQLKQRLIEDYPLPGGVEVISDDVFLTPEWALTPAATYTNGNVDLSATSLDQNGHLDTPVPKSSPAGPVTLDATLTSNKRITPKSHWQDVRLIEFLTLSIEYGPGDVLTIFPKNFAEDSDQLLLHLGWQGAADEPMSFVLSSEAADPPPPIAHLASNTAVKTITLRQLLTEHLDINAIPRRSFFATIAHFTDDETQKERLIEFTNPDLVDELYDYTTRPRRSIIEVLQEFHTVKLPYKWVLSFFPPIRGRQFSIASGGALKAGPDGSTRFELLVAIVKYKTVIKKIREGLCTRYLASLKPGAQMQVQLSKSGVKVDLERPAVMIGPGTGVAPLRSMIYERAATSQSRNHALIFGNRNRGADYFFEHEWEAFKSSNNLQVYTAFSRDQASKQYVQDAVRTQARAIFPLFQEGVVYVCGSSGKMPLAVRDALVDVFESEAPMSRSDAEAYLVRLEKEGRYQQETWG